MYHTPSTVYVKETEHAMMVTDSFARGGYYTSCACGWKGEICSYEWIYIHYQDPNRLRKYFEKEWNKHLEKKE